MSGSVWYISFSGKKIEFKKYPKKKKLKKIVKKQRKNYKKVLANLFLIFSLVIFLGVISSAEINDTFHINLQTTYSNGTIQSGTFTFAFNITENSSSNCSGPIVYNHSLTETTDTRGIVSIYLPTNGSGGGNLSELDFDKQYYLCYYRDGTLKDVSQLGRVPYSFRATQVNLSEITVDSNLNMTAFNVTASWFKGIYDWIIGLGSQSYLFFNGTQLDFNESQLNITIDSRISSGSANDSDFLDGYDSSFFMPLNTSVSGDFDFNGGWTEGGFSISGGDIYARTGYFYNISSLEVTNLEINGSLIPDMDDTFDLGNSSYRWRDLYLGGEISSNGTGDNYFLGNVGIGTASPNNPLDILTTGSGTGLESDSQLMIRGDNEPNEQQLKMGVNDTGYAYIQATQDNIGHNNLILQSLGGYVGIGTTSPGSILDIKSSGTSTAPLRITASGSSNTLGFFYQTSSDGGALYLRNSSNYNQVLISSDGKSYFNGGNVGIGTASPSKLLHIKGSASGATSGPTIRVENNGTGASNYYASVELQAEDFPSLRFLDLAGNPKGYVIYRNDVDAMTFLTNGSNERMRIDSSGNVGIGTTSPQQALHINGSAVINGTLNMDSNQINNLANGTSSQDAVTLSQLQAVNTSAVADETDPHWTGNYSNVAFTNINELFDENLSVVKNFSVDTDTLFVDSTNNKVGIGTTNPSVNLEVSSDSSPAIIISNETNASTQYCKLVYSSTYGFGEFECYGSQGHLDLEGGAEGDLRIFRRAESGENPNVYIYGYDTGASGTKWGSLNVDSSGDFNIEAQSGEVLRFRTGGGDKVTIDNSGYVGIGTTTPESNLEIAVNALDEPAIILSDDTGGDTDYWIGIDNDNGGDDDDDFQIGKGIVPGTTPYLTLDKDGNVGINTTSPGEKLEVAGNINSTGGDICISGGNCLSSMGAGTMSSFTLAGSSGSGQTITNGNTALIEAGNAITTTGAATDKVTVAVTANSINDDEVTDNSLSAGSLAADSVSDSELDGGFGWTLDTDLNIDSNTLVVSYDDNRVGIGLTDPSEELEVTGDIQLSGGANRAIYVGSEGVGDADGKDLTVRGGTGYGGFSTGGDLNLSGGNGAIGGNVYITGYDGISGHGDVFIAESIGKVGIGTTLLSSLLTTGISSGTNEVNLSGVLYVNSTSGNVGINTISPDQKLDVVGDIIIHPDETWNSGDTVSMYFGDTSSRINNTWGVGFEIRAGDDFIFTKPDNSADYFRWNNAGGTTLLTLDNDGDLNVTGELEGSRHSFPFGEETSHSPMDSFYLETVSGVTSSATKGYAMHRPGSIVGVSFEATLGSALGGEAYIEVRKNGVAVYSVTLTTSSDGEKLTYGTQSRGTDTFSATDIISLYYNVNTADCTVDDVVAYVEVVYDT